MAETEELRTKVVWETGDVDRGLQRVERAYSRMEKAEERAVSSQAALQARAEQDRVRNRERALRDLERMEKESADKLRKITEQKYRSMDASARFRQAAVRNAIRVETLPDTSTPGRGGSAMQRMSGAVPGAGGALIGRMSALGPVGGAAAGAAAVLAVTWRTVRREIQQTDSAAERLQDTSARLARTSAFTTTGAGRGTIAGNIEDADAHARAAREQQNDLSREWGPIGKAYDFLRKRLPFLGRTTEEKRQSADTDERVAAQAALRQRGLFSRTVGEEAASAREQSTGNPFEAERQQTDISETQEVAEAQKIGASEKDLQLIRQKWNIERERIARSEEASHIELSLAGRVAQIRTETLDTETDIAAARLEAAKSAFQNAGNSEERRAAYIAQKEAEAGVMMAGLGRSRRAAGRDSELATDRGRIGSQARILGLATDSADENVRFAATQSAARESAGAGMEEAQEALHLAERTVELEEEKFGAGKASLDTYHAQARAVNALVDAQTRAAALEKQLKADARERAVALGRQATAARSTTAAMRMQNSGRTDLATLQQSRDSSEAEAAEFDRTGRPEMAEQVRAQQKERETGMAMERLYASDGRKRPQRVLNREARDRRKTQRRRESAMDRLEKNGGRVNGRDVITGESTSDQSIEDQKVPDQKVADQAGQGGLVTGKLITGSLRTGSLRAGRGVSDDASWRENFSTGEEWRAPFRSKADQKRRADEKAAMSAADSASASPEVSVLKEIRDRLPSEVK